ncbi:hypothetical protein QBC40DRAFT_277009 [Triangularia verruculosa]|uniref:Uncharacterized protein n=1 Tax=Triangularia verruculosa TaxID=2587418 RepID=A0AAN6XJV5_9PEZI|nr:hypothetical protein QBC40DRAFT_277009 [Triangularia verruculosa]
MGLRFYSSDYHLHIPFPAGGSGIEDSIPDLDSLPKACSSSTRYFRKHNIDTEHNPKAKHPRRPFKWSTRRLHTTHQKAYEHWLWSSNYYWAHRDPSKQAPLRIQPHQIRAIVGSKAIGPKRAGVEPFVRTWAKRDLAKRRRQHEQRSCKDLADAGLDDHENQEVQLPFERERDRSERRQQRRRPPSLERQDAFRDDETSKRRRESMRRGGLYLEFSVCDTRDIREKYEVDDKIRLVGYEQAMYEKQQYEAAARGEVPSQQATENTGFEGVNLESWLRHEQELIQLCRSRFRVDIRHSRARAQERSTCDVLLLSTHDQYEKEWELIEGSLFRGKTMEVTEDDGLGPWIFVSPNP